MEAYYDQVGVQELVQAVIQQRLVMQKLMMSEGLLDAAKKPRSAFDAAVKKLAYAIPLAWNEGPVDELLAQAFQQRKALRKHYTAIADSFAEAIAVYHGSYDKAPKALRLTSYRKAALKTLDNLERIDQHYITMISMELDFDEVLCNYTTRNEPSSVSVLYEAYRARAKYFSQPTAKQLQRCVELFDTERILNDPEVAKLKLNPEYQTAPVYSDLCSQHDTLSVAAMLRTITN